MKRLIALIVLLLFALPALAEPMSAFDYTDNLLDDGSPIYYFEDLSLRLPVDWRGKVMALQDESDVSFYQIGSYEKYQAEGLNGGLLFSLGACVNDSFTELPSYQFLGFSERSCMNYFLMLPTDVQAYPDPDLMAEYQALFDGIDFIVKNAEIYPPLDAAETDPGFAPVRLSDFCGYDADALEGATLTANYIDCEEGILPVTLDAAESERIRALAMHASVTNKANDFDVSGDITVYTFTNAAGETLASISLHDGLLVWTDGMYRLDEPA